MGLALPSVRSVVEPRPSYREYVTFALPPVSNVGTFGDFLSIYYFNAHFLQHTGDRFKITVRTKNYWIWSFPVMANRQCVAY